jgi:hypothetical protein
MKKILFRVVLLALIAGGAWYGYSFYKSMPARQDFAMLAQQLDGSGLPLTQEQSKRLVDAYVTERGRVPMPTYTEGADAEEFGKSMNAWQADYSQRVSDEANHILNSDQLTAYNEIQQWQNEMREQMPGPRGFFRSTGGTFSATYVNGVATNVSSGPVNVVVAPAPADKTRKQ